MAGWERWGVHPTPHLERVGAPDAPGAPSVESPLRHQWPRYPDLENGAFLCRFTAARTVGPRRLRPPGRLAKSGGFSVTLVLLRRLAVPAFLLDLLLDLVESLLGGVFEVDEA